MDGVPLSIKAQRDICEFYLRHRDECWATEQDYRDLLRHYSLRDGLIVLGQVSRGILMSNDQCKVGYHLYIDTDTGVTVSQQALGYLANILLMSGANDDNPKRIGQLRDDLAVLCNSYLHCLIRPEHTQKYDLIDEDRLRSFMVRMYFEQKQPYQFSHWCMIARTIAIFGELIEDIHPDNVRIEPLPVVFKRETGLPLYDYLRLCFVVFVAIRETATFSVDTLSNAVIPHLQELMTADKVDCLMSILGANYGEFQKEDLCINDGLDPVFTTTRFNTLSIFPIIKTTEKRRGNPYIVPNTPIYIRKAYGGLYWWFHRHFQAQGRHLDFRTYFGNLFQGYVGKILKGIYGVENVHEEISYGKSSKFIDWWVEREDRIYLFEVKAYQFALLSAQTGDKETVVRNEMKKVAEAIEQVHRQIHEIPRHHELQVFRKKRIVPVIVFFDIPFISGNFFREWIKEALLVIEQRTQLAALQTFSVHLMNIEELELYDECVNTTELEDIFTKVEREAKDFVLALSELRSGSVNLRNRYLDSFYDDFKASLLG